MQQLLLPLLLVLALGVMFTLSGRRQKRQAQAQQELQKSLGPGDRVMTTSGLYGTIADASGDDTIDIEIAPGVVTTWLRLAIREKVAPAVDSADDTAEESEELEETVVEPAAHEAGEPQSTAQVAPPLEQGKK
jgi:preprotein translocase subunit YajC